MKCVLWAALAAAALCACAGGVRAQDAARAPRPAFPPDSALRCHEYQYRNRIYDFFVNRHSVTYEFTEDGIFTMECALRLALDEPALARFQPALRVRKVQLSNCWPRATTYAAALRALNVTALDEPGRGADSTYLMELNLLNANEFEPNVLAAMPNLRNLSITTTNLTIADLERLRKLRLENTWSRDSVPALALAAGALRGATALQEVSCIRCGLEALPAGLLDDARALRVLNLMDNRLHTLSGELLLGVLETVSTLNVLRLDDNPSLYACPRAPDAGLGAMQGWPPLSRLLDLSELGLRDTGTRRVCAGWRRLPRLARLDLFNTPIATLDALDLRNNALGAIDAATAAALVSRAARRVLVAGNPLECGCRAAAALAVVRAHPAVFRDRDAATCADGAPPARAAPPPCDNGAEGGQGDASRINTNPDVKPM